MAEDGRRPTPADPLPHAMAADQSPGAVVRDLPPELGPDAVGVLEGRSFMFSNAIGDVPRGSIGGLVHDDTRFLDRWELTINGSPLLVLGSCAVDAYSAAFFLANPELPGLSANRVGVRRQRFVGDGLHERIELQCFADDPVSIQLRLAVGTDFADIFEIKECVRDRSGQITRAHAPDGSRLSFVYENDTFVARTEVCASPSANRVEGDDLVWDLVLDPDRTWSCELSVPLHSDGLETQPTHRRFGDVFDGNTDDPTRRWEASKPTLTVDSELLRDVYRQSIGDLVAMRIEKKIGDESIILVAAGLPWFLTIFGRDSMITAYQTLVLGPDLARGTLLALGVHQGREVEDFTDQQPGKVMHEFRSGELTRLGVKPYTPYYGAADTTQLWLILFSEHWRWTRDDAFVHEMRDYVYAALNWIDEYGDLDGDGYVEYATRSPQGLGNQCWRDSWNGIQFADGSLPVLPIATCEVQGYTYDAWLRLAELADGPLGDRELAMRLRTQAAELRDRFNRDFWIEERGGYYAIGLDGDKRRIDSMTSNMGHLLWSGIVPPDRAAILARQLTSDRMFSGWGVRTTAADERGYNPIGYHMGTVWPHDNSIIAHGLARYGFRAEANRIIEAMLDAAPFSGHRLPEAFSGYDRSFGRMPVPYPTACSPQAWASGASLLFLRTMLGLDARHGRLILDPEIPERIGRVLMTGVHAFGSRWEIEANHRQGNVRLAPESIGRPTPSRST